MYNASDTPEYFVFFFLNPALSKADLASLCCTVWCGVFFFYEVLLLFFAFVLLLFFPCLFFFKRGGEEEKKKIGKIADSMKPSFLVFFPFLHTQEPRPFGARLRKEKKKNKQ